MPNQPNKKPASQGNPKALSKALSSVPALRNQEAQRATSTNASTSTTPHIDIRINTNRDAQETNPQNNLSFRSIFNINLNIVGRAKQWLLPTELQQTRNY